MGTRPSKPPAREYALLVGVIDAVIGASSPAWLRKRRRRGGEHRDGIAVTLVGLVLIVVSVTCVIQELRTTWVPRFPHVVDETAHEPPGADPSS